MSDSHRPLFRSPWWLLLFVGALEFWAFDQFGARRHTGIYPRWDDQVQYLSECYIAYEQSRNSGFLPALWHAFVHPSPQGTLHDAAALIVFTVAGPSRSAALALNMLALIAWQIALFSATSKMSGSRPFALAVAALPLALAGPWENIPGSAYDFRLDHLAMCALGLTSALATMTDGFRDRRVTVAFGVAAGLTLLTRFLSGTYLLLIFLALGAWAATRVERSRRLRNLAIAAAVATLMAAPILWLSRARLIDYYWIGHFVGPESAVRDAGLTFIESLIFVFRHLGERHLGIFFGTIAVLAVVVFFLGRGRTHEGSHGVGLLAAVFSVAPAIVFSLHRQKSEVVLSALVPGVVLAVAALWLRVAAASQPRKVQTWLPIALAALSLAFFLHRQFRPAYDPATLAQLRGVNTLADRLFDAVTRAPFPEPNIAVDHINDALHAEVLRVVFYERRRVWLPIRMTLPTGVVEPAADEVVARIHRSHIVILTDEPAPPGRYPFDEKLTALRPQLRLWCDANLRATEQFALFGRRMTLYQHPEIPFAAARP